MVATEPELRPRRLVGWRSIQLVYRGRVESGVTCQTCPSGSAKVAKFPTLTIEALLEVHQRMRPPDQSQPRRIRRPEDVGPTKAQLVQVYF